MATEPAFPGSVACRPIFALPCELLCIRVRVEFFFREEGGTTIFLELPQTHKASHRRRHRPAALLPSPPTNHDDDENQKLTAHPRTRLELTFEEVLGAIANLVTTKARSVFDPRKRQGSGRWCSLS